MSDFTDDFQPTFTSHEVPARKWEQERRDGIAAEVVQEKAASGAAASASGETPAAASEENAYARQVADRLAAQMADPASLMDANKRGQTAAAVSLKQVARLATQPESVSASRQILISCLRERRW